jgi:integrase
MSGEFNFSSALRRHTPSENTHRAYERWVERYLVEYALFKPLQGKARARRMASLSVGTLQRHLTKHKLHTWLVRLADNGVGRQALDQARAAVVTLAQLLTEAGHLNAERLAQVRSVHVPSVAPKQTPERVLSAQEVALLIQSSQTMTREDVQAKRNAVIMALLCTMALRREELSRLKWGDVALREGKVCLRVGEHWLDVPRNVLNAIDQWRASLKQANITPTPESALVRRIWRGGVIAQKGLSPDGLWLIVHASAKQAGLGEVTPEDLRRSVIVNMMDAGMSLADACRLLRHRNLTVTKRFLAKMGRDDLFFDG